MYVFLKKEETVFGKYNEILKKIGNIIKKELNSKLAHNKKYLKAEKTEKLSVLLYTSNID